MFMRKNILAAFCFTCFLAAGMLGCKKDNAGAHNTGAAMTVDSFIATQGGGGTEILVSGNNFSSDTLSVRVFINGHRLAVDNANYHQIMAVVPKKCGSGKVIVKIGRDSAVSKGIFNYTYTHIVSTLAGNGVAGFANGNGTDAQFNFNGQAWYRSSGVAVDDKLNVYVADPGNSCIRKIDSLGNVTTFAGSPGNGGYADGQGSAARFSIPYDVAVDGAGNVYSVDPGNWDIRKITPDGTATALAWGNQAPWSVAVDKTTGYVYYTSCDPSGNVYPVDAQGNTGSPVVTGLKYPAGIGFDKTGNLYVSMNGEQVIRKYTAGSWTGSIIAGQAGSSGYVNGPGPSAKFAYPWGLALDSAGNIYIAGNGTWDGGTYNADQSVRYIEANTWQVSSFAGSNNAGYVDAIGQAAAFSAPTGVAVDKYGNVYVLDKNNNRIRKIVSE
jgi:sugar lactone lactonase YvrE